MLHEGISGRYGNSRPPFGDDLLNFSDGSLEKGSELGKEIPPFIRNFGFREEHGRM